MVATTQLRLYLILVVELHLCSIPITLNRCTFLVATVLTLHCLQPVAEVIAANPSMQSLVKLLVQLNISYVS